MSGEIDLPLPDPGSLRRGRFTYFPVVPGRLEFAIEVRQAILRDRPQAVALELPATLQAAWMRAVARLPEMSLIFYPDEDAEDDQAVYVPVEPADPFTEAIRTGDRNRRRNRLCRSRFRAARPTSRTPIRTPTPSATSASNATWRLTASTRSRARRKSRAHAAGIAWKLQGTDPSSSVLVVVSLNLLDPLLDAMEEPQAQPLARLLARGRRAVQSAPRIAGRDLRRVSAAPVALRTVSAADDGRQPDRPPARPTRGLSGGRKGIRSQHRRTPGPLAAAPAGALLPQPGAGRQRTLAPASST